MGAALIALIRAVVIRDGVKIVCAEIITFGTYYFFARVVIFLLAKLISLKINRREGRIIHGQ